MTPEKQEVLWEKMVKLKETPGKGGATPEKRGEPKVLCDDIKGSYFPAYAGNLCRNVTN